VKYFKLDKKGKAELASRIKENHKRETKQMVSYGPRKYPELDTVTSLQKIE